MMISGLVVTRYGAKEWKVSVRLNRTEKHAPDKTTHQGRGIVQILVAGCHD
jgi:hypothetical protein